MRITVFITPEALGARPLQAALEARRDALARQGVHFAQGIGRRNHTRLFMAVSDPERPDALRVGRGYATAAAQALLSDTVRQELAAEVERVRPQHLVLACAQLSSGLVTEAELQRLRGLLAPLSEDIRLVLHVEDQARALVRHLSEQVMFGRYAGPEQELALATAPDWRQAAINGWGKVEPRLNRFPEYHGAPHFLDWTALRDQWNGVFGDGALRLRPYDRGVFHKPKITREIEASLGLDSRIGTVDAAEEEPLPSDVSLTRFRQMNALFERLLATGRVIPRPLWRRMLGELAVPGEPLAAGSLSPISRRFAAANAALVEAQPELAAALTPDPELPDWVEPSPGPGFRATQYLTVFLPRIDKATAEARAARQSEKGKAMGQAVLSPEAEKLLPPLAKSTFATLAGGRYAPHNRLGRVNEAEPGAPYAERPARPLPEGSSGAVIVGCMKNEAPYIVEWVAYHRAIGVDNFLIYTNGCEDGTDEILDRLQEMGVLQHRLNDDWKGNSPQQAALNKSLKEPLVRDADWLIHIDVDEFINIRTGNGTLEDLIAAVPGATNIAMTWRLFGHDGVRGFEDKPVIEQFTACAPAWCPKPHTVWGFKSMFRNIGAYAKMSCHRPNKLAEDKRALVRWVNGSGQPMADSLKDKGWRSGTGDIGYDLVQLNHYALRSAESFLIKRQRGRALHVDRSIGLNYWIRMDWGDYRDLTIQRNLPRLRAEMARLLADEELARLHRAGCDWHRAKAAELRATAEFAELYDQALETRLTAMERVAYALALDMES